MRVGNAQIEKIFAKALHKALGKQIGKLGIGYAASIRNLLY